MTNKQIVSKMLEILEKEHLNLYHSISKEQVLNYIGNMKGINQLSLCQFDFEMLKLFALFKDAHTSYFIKYIPMNCWVLLE